MAIHVTAYVAPLIGGAAFVAPEATLASLRGAGSLLADVPKGVQLVLCVPESGPRQVDASARFESAARSLFRRAAIAATVAREVHPAPAVGRLSAALRRTLVGFGWLLLLTGGTIGAGLGGLWLAFGFPLGRRRTLERADPSRAASALAHPIEGAPIAARSHAGLTSLAQLLSNGDSAARSPRERYRQAAVTCPTLGLVPLVDFYDALARGVAPAMPWALVPAAEEVGNGPLHESA